jgi:hypothetical protein
MMTTAPPIRAPVWDFRVGIGGNELGVEAVGAEPDGAGDVEGESLPCIASNPSRG